MSEFLRNHMLTPTEAAAHCGISPASLPRWEDKYGFPVARKLGGRLYYSKAEVFAWLSSSARVEARAGRRVGDDHPRSLPTEFIPQVIRLRDKGMSIGGIALKLGLPKATVQCWLEGRRRAIAAEDVAARVAGRK